MPLLSLDKRAPRAPPPSGFWTGALRRCPMQPTSCTCPCARDDSEFRIFCRVARVRCANRKMSVGNGPSALLVAVAGARLPYWACMENGYPAISASDSIRRENGACTDHSAVEIVRPVTGVGLGFQHSGTNSRLPLYPVTGRSLPPPRFGRCRCCAVFGEPGSAGPGATSGTRSSSRT